MRPADCDCPAAIMYFSGRPPSTVAAWARDMDQFNYDMTWAAWSGGLFKDPESMWHSKEADRPAGSNITGFRDERVDRLIEEQKAVFDIGARNAICRQIDEIVTHSHRAIVFREGRPSVELDHPSLTRDAVLAGMFGLTGSGA